MALKKAKAERGVEIKSGLNDHMKFAFGLIMI